MFYCPFGDWVCPYLIADCRACLLDDLILDCDDYAMLVEEEEMGVIDMFALNP